VIDSNALLKRENNTQFSYNLKNPYSTVKAETLPENQIIGIATTEKWCYAIWTFPKM
jgi:hypothetical protein